MKNLGEFSEGEVLVVLGSESYSSIIKEHINSLFKENNINITFIHKDSGEPNEGSLDNIFSQIENKCKKVKKS